MCAEERLDEARVPEVAAHREQLGVGHVVRLQIDADHTVAEREQARLEYFAEKPCSAGDQRNPPHGASPELRYRFFMNNSPSPANSIRDNIPNLARNLSRVSRPIDAGRAAWPR